MKKLLSFFAAGLLLASCSNDDFAPKGTAGSEEEVTISVTLPDDIASRAVAGGENSKDGGVLNNADAVTFTVALYYNNGTTPVFTGTAEASSNPRTAVFKPTLVIGETYQLVAYAQFDGEADLNAQAEAFGLNDEKQDAYFLSTDIVAEPVMYGELKRPTGKLRLIALDYGLMKSQLQKDIANVTVTYEDARYTTFNSRTGEWTGAAAETAYTAERIDYNTEDYDAQATYTTDESVAKAKTVFVDYIPVNTSGDEHVSIVVEVEFEDGSTFTREINLDIPIKRNYLTTLVGDFFTSEMELTLVIDPIFEKEEVYNYNDLATAFELGGEYKLYNHVTVTEPIELTNKNLVLDLNGYKVQGTDAISNNGVIVVGENSTLTIKGDGYVTAIGSYPVAVKDGGVLNIESGNFTATESSQAVYVYEGTANISGGYYAVEGQWGYGYTLNCKDDKFQAGTASIVVTGGKFSKFDPSAGHEPTGTPGEYVGYLAEGFGVSVEGDVYTVVPAAVDGVTTLRSASDLVWFADQVNSGKSYSGETVVLAADIDLAGIEWTPIGQTGGYYASTYFKGTFDGQEHTIKNLTVTKWEAGTDGGANYASGLFGFTDCGTQGGIKNLTIDGATVKGSHWCGVVSGYVSGVVENCHVKNATVECTHANGEACGDKAGAVAGFINGKQGSLKGCTAENSTVKAGRDAGQVVGAAEPAQVVDCSATNVTVSATGDCPKEANIREAVIGRELP